MAELPWGADIDAPDVAAPAGTYLRALHNAANRNASFTVIGWRRVDFRDGTHSDYLVVEADDGSVPGRNPAGILRRERLALGYRPRLSIPLEVRALRADFPDVPHLNAVGANEPRALCLYDDVWPGVERTWTAEHHLARILWWLRETAFNTLHAPDQALEPAFYGAPYKVLLPHALRRPAAGAMPALRLVRVSNTATSAQIVRGIPDPGAGAFARQVGSDFLTLEVPAASASFIRHFPRNLRALHDDFVAMGSDLIDPLRARLLDVLPANGLRELDDHSRIVTLVVVTIPRERDGLLDSFDVRGFVVAGDVVALGLACGALARDPGGVLCLNPPVTEDALTKANEAALSACADLGVENIEVLFELDAAAARLFSDVEDSRGQFRGVLVGAGALGGCLAEIWMREGWGVWDIVDDDVLLPHNTVRHLGGNPFLGLPKAEIVHALAGFERAEGRAGQALVTAFRQTRSQALSASLQSAALLVDASTTLYVARDALDDTLPRMATVFLTPTGHASVLLLETGDRSIRVAHLEPQYYRALIRGDWGGDHLKGRGGQAWVGGGCRRTSLSLSNELIHIHAGVLARQLRRAKENDEARACVWTYDEGSGSVRVNAIAVAEPRTQIVDDWRVVWDADIQARVFEQRVAHLPSETGGILLGYIDQKLRAVFIVDALPAPLDSDGDKSGFSRGTQGVLASIEGARRHTGGIVDYIGEWHSHPVGHSVGASVPDVLQLAYLAALRAQEGQVTVMLIAGDNDVGIHFARPAEGLT